MRPHILSLCLTVCALTRAADVPLPTITSASPNLIDAGGPYFLITVNGSGFIDSSYVNWSGNPLSTIFVSSTQLKAAITPDLRTSSGKFNLTVINPGAPVSNSYPITVSPVLATITPAAVLAGSPAVTITATGIGFTRGEVLALTAAGQQNPLITTYVNSATLTAVIPADALAVARTAAIQVLSLDGSASGSLPFGIRNAPAIASATPNPIDAGGSSFLLTVTGTGFAPDSVVSWAGSRLATRFVTSATLQAAITPDLRAVSGTFILTVSDATGAISGPYPITVSPVLFTISPSASAAAGPPVTITATGVGFTSNSVLVFIASGQPSPLATTYVNATTLTGVIPASALHAAGSASVQVADAKGVGHSLPQPFTIALPVPAITSLSPGSATAGAPHPEISRVVGYYSHPKETPMKIPDSMPIALGMIVCFSSAARAANASPEQIRGAAAKGVRLILSSQKTWHAKQSCYSCQQQALPALALRAVREHGISFDEKLAGASAVQSFAFLTELDRAIQYTHIIDPAITEGYILAGAHAAGVRPSLTTAVYARFIANRQRVDGHWDSLDVRPPQSYSPFTATTTALHAIQLYGHPSLAADTKARVNRARVWLASNFPHNTEERTMQVLGLSWADADRVQIDKAAHDLKAEQQPDGGWNALDGLPTEAYSTGEALVALHTAAGIATSDAAWERGLHFLLSTQEGDGSWHVVSRLHPPAPVSPPYFEAGYPYGHDQFISSMGASWAVRALAEALGPPRKIEVAELSQAAPKGVEPWMETVLFGSAANLRALLDKGLDPNAATKSGGTTALMMAMPDVEKAKLLLDRGARINGRAKTKCSALMVASQYSGSAPVMRLLLDRGAEVRLPKGAGAPLFNASPFVLAASAGNAEILPRLRGAGDKVDAAMLLLGSFPSTGLQVAVFFGDIATTRAALDCGASIDQPDDDGITPLGWAAIGNQAGVARVLIERGADLNHVDKKGMTPLLYAASIDYGDSAMIDLLLKSGANRNARTKEGQTAAALARQYKHIHLYKSLGAGL